MRAVAIMSADLEAEEGRQPSEEPLLDCRLDHGLRRIEILLSLLGFLQSTSVFASLLHILVFISLGLVIPIGSAYFSRCLKDGCKDHEVRKIELWVLAPQVALAVVSIGCVSVYLRRDGLRMFLFSDHDQGRMEKFQDQYVKKIQEFICIFLWCFCPCFLVNIIREVVRSGCSAQNSLWISVAISVASILGWSYLTAIFLSACALFNLVCNIRIIHVEDFGEQFEIERDLTSLLKEHFFIRNCLTTTSHTFRKFLLFAFLLVSASQVLTLSLTMGYSGTINTMNAVGIVVSSVVQIVGMILCLYSASKISHRAQAVASQAGKWNAEITCATDDLSEGRLVNNGLRNCGVTPLVGLAKNQSENDLEPLDKVVEQVNVQMAFSLSMYHKRQSLVTYLQGNPGGITIFGFTVDRALIITIIFFELSLILFVLGKTIELSDNQAN